MTAAWRAWRIYRGLMRAGQIALLLIVLTAPQHPIVAVFAAAGVFATLRRIGRRRRIGWPW
jgi:hypothetical protein